MTNYKLTYFDMDGGRAEPVRIAFHAAGIDFEDHRISFAEFMETRKQMRFHCAPTLEIDGEVVTQSNAMCRYIGRMGGLYPEDDLQAMCCDEALGAIEDLLHQMVGTFGLEGDELKAAREKLADGWIAIFLKGLNEMLERGGGKYFAGNRLSVADLKVWVTTKWFISGQLDHIPTDIVEKNAPLLAEHAERVAADPIVTAYYASKARRD
jgi:glutathione S-transferase